MFWSFGLVGFFKSHFDDRALLKPVVGSVTSVAHFITDHEVTQNNYMKAQGVLQ